MGKGVMIVWLQTSNWKGLTIDIPMDQKAYSPRHPPCDRRHLTVSLLIRWGCVLLLVPDCIKGHEPLFSQARLRALIETIPPMYYHPHTNFYVCSSTLCQVYMTSRRHCRSHPTPGQKGEGKAHMRTPGIIPDYSLSAVVVCCFFSYGRPKRHVAFFPPNLVGN
jgi:hypothetical protein